MLLRTHIIAVWSPHFSALMTISRPGRATWDLVAEGGILRIAFPALTKSIGEAMLAREAVLRVAAGIQVVLGAFLMIMGYQ